MVPSARRVCLLRGEDYRRRLDEIRQRLATGHFDTFLAVPRGVRDEEVHTAVSELLSDWGWSSSSPVVANVDIVTDRESGEGARIRDFFDRMGIASATHAPDSGRGAAILAEVDGEVAFPVVTGFGRPSLPYRSSPAARGDPTRGSTHRPPRGVNRTAVDPEIPLSSVQIPNPSGWDPGIPPSPVQNPNQSRRDRSIPWTSVHRTPTASRPRY